MRDVVVDKSRSTHPHEVVPLVAAVVADDIRMVALLQHLDLASNLVEPIVLQHGGTQQALQTRDMATDVHGTDTHIAISATTIRIAAAFLIKPLVMQCGET